MEVGEPFKVEGYNGEYHVNDDGVLKWGGQTSDDAIYEAINHPDRIIRKPRFTEEEVADAKAILRILPHVDTVGRMENGLLYCYDRGMEQVNICGGLFPTLRPGQAVRLEDIT